MTEPESNTRAITPPRASPHEATTPERVRQVELNRLRGRYMYMHSTLCLRQPYPLFLIPIPLFLVPFIDTYDPRYAARQRPIIHFHFTHNTQPRQNDAKKKRLLHLALPPRRCAIPTTKDPSPSSPRLPTRRLARRTTTMRAAKNN
jgi:hypothetical protein